MIGTVGIVGIQPLLIVGTVGIVGIQPLLIVVQPSDGSTIQNTIGFPLELELS